MTALTDFHTNLLGIICSHLTLQEIFKLKQANSSLRQQAQSASLWKSVLAQWREHSAAIKNQDPTQQGFENVTDQALSINIPNSLLQSKENLVPTFVKELALTLTRIRKTHKTMEIEGVEASSQDYNQSIFRTLDRKNPDLFWSSTGSPSPDYNEYLIYKVAGHNQRALIHSVVLCAFQPRFQIGYPLYAPREIQIEVGNRIDQYHYKSKKMSVLQNSTEEQLFALLPDVVVGEFIKINLLGKPMIQTIDNQYYVSLRFVGIKGINLRDINYPTAQELLTLCTRAEGEEEIIQDTSAQEENQLRQTMNKIKDLKTGNQQQELGPFMFKNRRIIQQHLKSFYPSLLIRDDIVKLLAYSGREYGVIDYSLTHLLFDILDIHKANDNDVYQFCEQLGLQFQVNGADSNLYMMQERLDNFLYPQDSENKVSLGTKRLFLRTFLLFHEIYELSVTSHPVVPFPTALNHLNIVVYQVAYSQGKHVDFERLVRATIKTYGKTQTIQGLRAASHSFFWQQDLKDELQELLRRLEEE